MSGLLSVHLGMFSFVEGYLHYLGGIISTAKGAHYNGGEIDHKLQHIIDDTITVLIIYPSVALMMSSTFHCYYGGILPMEVLLDFQDGGILEFGGFQIDIKQYYLRSDI